MEMKGWRENGRSGSIGLMKFVSWGTLTITLLSSLFLAIFLANYARKVLLDKQRDIAQLLANTLNTTITKRFYSPVYWQTMGKVNLNNPDQYKLLDELIQENMKTAPFQEVRIYDMNGVLIYAQDKALLGRKNLGGEPVTQAIEQEKTSQEFLYQTGPLGAFFSAEIAPRSVIMRTTAPVQFKGVLPVEGDVPGEAGEEKPETGQTGGGEAETGAAHPEEGQGALPGLGQNPGTGAENPAAASGADHGVPGELPSGQGKPSQGESRPREAREAPSAGQGATDEEKPGHLVEVEGVIGGLEFTLDITPDYQKLVTFQRIIIISALGTSMVLFLVLRMLIHRADRINVQRMLEKESYEREMAQNEKLVSMGRMVAGIAHEIRNPLGIIRSSSELLVTRLKDKDPLTSKILAAINEEAVRLSKTVGDFLDYARPKTLKLEPVDLGSVLEQALAFLEQKCREEGVEVVREVTSGVIIQADRDLLYRALYNILVNAMEAMAARKDTPGEGGEEGDVRGQIVVQVGREKGDARLSVTDTGPGIPPEIKDKLLDPFFTTKESGTGLGLAITASILRSHGAALTIGDNPEGGARVDIIFART